METLQQDAQERATVDEKSIFLQALDKAEGDARSAWLDEAGGRGTPLRSSCSF